jgi:hypothetical protein
VHVVFVVAYAAAVGVDGLLLFAENTYNRNYEAEPPPPHSVNMVVCKESTHKS